VIVAHLGSGASLTAVSDGRSVDTTMGLTPAGGILMSSRAGDLDPGVIVHLLRHAALSVAEVEHLLNHEAGLKGLAGSADMAALLARDDDDARLAVDSFCYAIKKQIGAYLAVLGGLDCLVFTGGIGEHSPEIRRRALAGLGGLGLELDPEPNAANAPVISSRHSRCLIRVIRSNEALMIARHCWRVMP
jgi:acetate kinase